MQYFAPEPTVRGAIARTVGTAGTPVLERLHRDRVAKAGADLCWGEICLGGYGTYLLVNACRHRGFEPETWAPLELNASFSKMQHASRGNSMQAIEITDLHVDEMFGIAP